MSTVGKKSDHRGMCEDATNFLVSVIAEVQQLHRLERHSQNLERSNRQQLCTPVNSAISSAWGRNRSQFSVWSLRITAIGVDEG